MALGTTAEALRTRHISRRLAVGLSRESDGPGATGLCGNPAGAPAEKTAGRVGFEAEQLSNTVQKAQEALQAYKEQSQTVSFEEGRNAVSEKLKEFSKQHAEAESQMLSLKSDLELIEKIKDVPEALLRVPSVYQDPAISALRNNVLNQETLVATLTNKWKPKYPKMIEEQQKLENLRTQLRGLVLKSPEKVKSSYEAAQGHERSLLEKLRQVEQQELTLSSNAIPYASLQRAFTRESELYDTVLKRLK